jgi:hypothetical protein
MTEWDLEYLWAGGPPRRSERLGGWLEYYFSSDVPGGKLAIGSDSNPCTWLAPCLTTAKMLALAAPGAHFILDDEDDWNTSTTFTASFVLDQARIGCPLSSDEVCVWFSTTAADPTVDTVAWGKPSGSPRNCMNVTSDGTDRGWVFFDGFAVTCDAAGAATDADGPDTNLRGKLWCSNCPVLVTAADGADNAATAHAAGITVISGVSPLAVAEDGVANNPLVATTGGGAILILTRQFVSHRQTAAHGAAVVAAGCGGACSTAANNCTPAVVLIGPHLECGAGCTTASALLCLNPDQVDPVEPIAIASALVAFTAFEHASSTDTYAIRTVASSANEMIRFRGYRNSYLTMDRVWYMGSGQLDPGATIDVEDVEFVAVEPRGGAGGDGAIIHFADPDWRTAVVSFVLDDFLYDNEADTGEANSQCYLESDPTDLVATTMDACQSAIEASEPSGTWSVAGGTLVGANEPSAAGVFAQNLPAGVVLPDFVTGSRIEGVYLGGRLATAIDVVPGSDANRIDLRTNALIEVAALGSDGFHAADVDVTTLGFGPGRAAPTEAAGGSLEDVNEDGFVDLVSHYQTAATGLASGDTEACAAGKLLDGFAFEGCDVVRIVSSPPSGGCGLGPELALLLAPIVWLHRSGRRHGRANARS